MPNPEQSAATGPGSPHEPQQANPRVVVAVLAVISVAALVLGFFQIMNTIRLPFSENRAATNEGTNSAALASDAKLRSQDTDGDGISDLDELTLTFTSPFLKDSDSDGNSDKSEIDAGTNPNCPEGTSCGWITVNANTNATVNTNASGNKNSATTLLGSSQTAALVRQILKDAGAPAYVVDNLDDAGLLELYDSVLGEVTGQTGANGNANAASTTDVLTSLKGLSAAEIRSLLIGGGADASLLQQMDDASLQAIFLQALNEEQTSNTNATTSTQP